MKQFIDYIPLLIFFTVFAIDERTVSIGGFEHSIGGIFSAAEFLLAALYSPMALYSCSTGAWTNSNGSRYAP